jgi:dihydroflavonol-4-reductase
MILVTGSAGLLGKELVGQLLLQGKTVKAAFNQTRLPDFNNDNLLQEQVDILDVVALEKVMKGVDEVYHCAALVSFSPKDESRLYKINVEGTANIVNAALAAGVRKIVHVSSVAALGRIREGETINETMQWSPATSNSKYGHSKYLGEMELWRGVAEGLDAVVVNPVIILGPADWNESSTKIFRSVYNEFPYYTEGITGFVDVRDVATAMILLMQSDISGERFIISAENISYHSLFDMIAKAFGKKLPHKNVTPFMAKAFWRWEAFKKLFTGKDPLVTKETTVTALAKVYFDNTKLLKALPQFFYHRLEDTVEYTCNLLQQKINK